MIGSDSLHDPVIPPAIITELFSLASTSKSNFEHLKKNQPTILKAKGLKDRTLLHYIIISANKNGTPADMESIVAELFKLTADGTIDFHAKDRDGYTALDMLSYNLLSDWTMSTVIFPAFLTEAVKRGYDFSQLNPTGRALIHMVAISGHQDPNVVCTVSFR